MADAHRGPRYQLAMAAAKVTQAALTAAHRNGGQLPGVIDLTALRCRARSSHVGNCAKLWHNR